MSDCGLIRHEIGAYVLDGLPPEEAHVVAAHLEHCAECQVEHADIADTPALLELAREVPPRVPARVRDRVVAAAARRQARRTWLVGVAAAVLIAAAVGGFIGWQLAPAATREVAVPLETVEPFEAAGWATFVTGDGEITVELALEGLEELENPAVYEAWVSTQEDRVLSIGQLEAGSDGNVTVALPIEGEPDSYRGLWITAEPDRRDPAHAGPTVLRSPFPRL